MSRSHRSSRSSRSSAEKSTVPRSSAEDFGSNAAFQAKMSRVQGSSEGGSLLVLSSPIFKTMVDGDMGNAAEVQGLVAEHELLGDVYVTRKYGDSAVEAHAPGDGIDQVKAAFEKDRYVTMRAE